MKFRLLTMPGCPYCVAAMRLLEEKDISFEVQKCDMDAELLLEHQKEKNWNTVPMIFEVSDGENFIGGYEDLVEYLKNGKVLLQG